MTRKRFIKLAMGEGCNKRTAEFGAMVAHLRFGNYKNAYNIWGSIKGRFEFYAKN